ncbi:MAG: tetratricopeptide repeat protein [Candidatus Electronema sp. VV]
MDFSRFIGHNLGYAQENYDAALEYLKQDLTISQQIGARRVEGTTLNNIAAIYEAKGDYTAALKQCEQSLAIAKEIDDKDGEASCRWNIGGVLYEAR